MLLNIQWSRCNVTLECKWPEMLPVVPMDEPKVAPVMLNRCKNAVEAMVEGGGTLTLSAGVGGDMLYITVADTGCGVPVDFDLCDAFATRKPSGTGLGLPVVRDLVHAHGGQVRHESVPGKGSIFFVSLPLESPHPEAAPM